MHKVDPSNCFINSFCNLVLALKETKRPFRYFHSAAHCHVFVCIVTDNLHIIDKYENYWSQCPLPYLHPVSGIYCHVYQILWLCFSTSYFFSILMILAGNNWSSPRNLAIFPSQCHSLLANTISVPLTDAWTARYLCLPSSQFPLWTELCLSPHISFPQQPLESYTDKTGVKLRQYFQLICIFLNLPYPIFYLETQGSHLLPKEWSMQIQSNFSFKESLIESAFTMAVNLGGQFK